MALRETWFNEPHYSFVQHIKAGGRVFRNDPQNNVQEYLDLERLDGDANNVRMYGYSNLTRVFAINDKVCFAHDSIEYVGQVSALTNGWVSVLGVETGCLAAEKSTAAIKGIAHLRLINESEWTRLTSNEPAFAAEMSKERFLQLQSELDRCETSIAKGQETERTGRRIEEIKLLMNCSPWERDQEFKVVRPFAATPEMIAAAECVFFSMATEAHVRPIVEGYQKQILENGQWHINPKYVGQRGTVDRIILDPRHSYLLSEPDFEAYLQACKRARDAAGLVVDDDEKCPLLVAEDAVRCARRALVDIMEPVTGLSADRLLTAGEAKYMECVELTLRLLAPMVDREKTLVASLSANTPVATPRRRM